MNAGARPLYGDAFAFVHADTIVPARFAAISRRWPIPR